MTLTPRQQAVADFVRGFCIRNHYSPTIEEIGAAVGLKSKSSVAHHIKTLRRLGVLADGELHQKRMVHPAAPARRCPVCLGTGIDIREEAA